MAQVKNSVFDTIIEDKENAPINGRALGDNFIVNNSLSEQ